MSAAESRLPRVAKAALSVVLAGLVVVALLLVVFGFLARPGKDGVSRVGGHPVLTVLSGSMVPVFHPGDLVIDDKLALADAGRLAPGTIVTFHVPGSPTHLITHRIVAVQHAPGTGEVAYQTQGDANNAPDPDAVPPAAIVGVYSKHLPAGGYVLQAVQKKQVFFFLIFIPLVYLIGAEVAKRWREPASTTSAAGPLPRGTEGSSLARLRRGSADRVPQPVGASTVTGGGGEPPQ